MDILSQSDSVDRHAPLIHPTDGMDSANVCIGADLDTCDPAVSSSQSTDATAAEADCVTMNPAASLLPVVTNKPQ